MQAARRWLPVILVVLLTLVVGPMRPALASPPVSAQEAPAQQTALLSMILPTDCPSEGCAGGQRLGMRFDFSLTNTGYIDNGQKSNIEICVYAPKSWSAVSDDTEILNGEITSSAYSKSTDCVQNDPNNPTSGYIPILQRVTWLPTGTPRDALRFAFRLGTGASGNGGLIAHLLVFKQSGWASALIADSTILSVTVPATANPSYVANDPGACGSYSPCYVNSDGDFDKGIGTGLKDAVDALQPRTTINILGNYTIKTTTVVIDKPMILTGIDNAKITYSGSSSKCNGAMLALDSTITLKGLNIDDGSCTQHRNLVEINSQTGGTGANDVVQILSNDLSGGANGIVIKDTTIDPVLVYYNQIEDNEGFAIYYDGAGGAPLEVTANNLDNNQASTTGAKPASIECGSSATKTLTNRDTNHNYWGGGSPTAKDTHCSIAANKRLGGRIDHNTSGPGLKAQQVVVTTTKTYAPGSNNQIAYARSGSGGSNFNMYVVDYGYMPGDGAPFTLAQGGDSPSPCSNYWDVFLADGETVTNTLELYFKYNKTSGCRTTINSTLYCNQTTSPSKYPLFWFDPGGVTDWWDNVGASPVNLTTSSGQDTTCHISDNEIQVSIDGNSKHRPNLSDLGYTPFVVGIPVLKSFEALASSQMVTLKWVTNNETEISGFNIWRGDVCGSGPCPMEQINLDLITHTGNSSNGATYSKPDNNLTNGSVFYYRLEVVRTDGNSIFSNWEKVTVNIATATPPPATRTATIPYPTYTRTATRVTPKSPTLIPTRTYTPRIVVPTPTPLNLPTLTETFFIDTRTPGAMETMAAMLTGTPDLTQTLESGGTGYPVNGSGTPIAALTPGANQTPGMVSTARPGEAVAGASTGGSTHPWLSLLLGTLAGLAAVGATGGVWYYTTHR